MATAAAGSAERVFKFVDHDSNLRHHAIRDAHATTAPNTPLPPFDPWLLHSTPSSPLFTTTSSSLFQSFSSSSSSSFFFFFFFFFFFLFFFFFFPSRGGHFGLEGARVREVEELRPEGCCEAALAVVMGCHVHELQGTAAEARVQPAEVQARHAVGCPVALAAVPPSSP